MNNINNFRVLEWFYKELFQTKKKVLVILLPFYECNYKATNHIHRYFIVNISLILLTYTNITIFLNWKILVD